MSTICIIPARGGSRRIPGKNIKDFLGKPILARSINKARDSGLFDRIIVSTDSGEIGRVAEAYGAEVWQRDPAYGRNEVGTQDVVKECLLGIQAEQWDEVCCIYATSPMLSIEDLCEGYMLLTNYGSGDVDFVMSVGYYPDLADAGQFYWGLCDSFTRDLPLISPHTRMILVDEKRICDINTPEDWDRAVKMYGELE